MTWKTAIGVAGLAGVLVLAGCAGTVGDSAVDSELLQGEAETGALSAELTGGVPIGSTLKTTGNLNLRTGAGTGYTVRLVIPKGAQVTTVNRSTPSSGWYNIKYNGIVGWSYGSYLTLVSSPSAGGVSGSYPVGSTLQTTVNLNLRSGVGTSYSVLTTIPSGANVTTVQADPSSGWYNIKYNGTVGWSSGTYLVFVSSPSTGGGGGGTTSSPRDELITKAKSGVGFSYWWGHGRWVPGGLSSSTRGTCTGNCPNCSHGGSYGADCSGFVGKVWSVPSSNSDPTSDSHPYSTASFNGSSSQWKTVTRANALAGDALVYNNGSSGHIFIYESGDAWGSMWAYEAKGCSYGIIHDLRTATSSYKVIRKSSL